MFAETAGFEPARGVNPYLLSREAHSTGLCDVSNADYSKAFSSQTRNALRPYCCRDRGGQGIRTPGAIADTTVFKTVTFGHSVSPPDPPIIADLDLFAHSSSRICSRSLYFSAVATERNPRTAVGWSLFRMVQQASGNRGSKRRPHRHSANQNALNCPGNIPAARPRIFNPLIVKGQSMQPLSGQDNKLIVNEV